MPADIRSDPPTTLILIRHGQSQANVDRCFGGHSPSPLTDLGIEQAEQTAQYLAAERAKSGVSAGRIHLYSSDLLRAMQTAQPIAKSLALPLESLSGLRERSVGELDGKPFHVAQEERPELWKRLLGKDPKWCPDGGESVHQAHERIAACLRELIAKHAGEKLILVTHGIIMHLGINALLGHDSHGAMLRYFEVGNASRSTLVIGPRRIRVCGINQTEHLQGPT